VDVVCSPVIAGVGERVNGVRRDSGVLGWLRLRVSLPVTTIGSDWRCCGRRRDPVDVRLVVLKILKTNRWFSEVRNRKGNRTVPEGRLRRPAARRNRRITVTGAVDLRREIVVDLAVVLEKDQREMREERERVL
jgi:hypothetical protein